MVPILHIKQINYKERKSVYDMVFKEAAFVVNKSLNTRYLAEVIGLCTTHCTTKDSVGNHWPEFQLPQSNALSAMRARSVFRSEPAASPSDCAPE